MNYEEYSQLIKNGKPAEAEVRGVTRGGHLLDNDKTFIYCAKGLHSTEDFRLIKIH